MMSSTHFHWHKESRCFSAELSDFNGLSAPEIFERLWNDSCDVGIKMISEKTGRKAWYYLKDEVRDREGDLQYYLLEPTEQTVKKFPQLKNSNIKIFND